MNSELTQKSCADFAQVLASSAPVPGGGAAALTGALGATLGSMVANLTVGRKAYAQYEEDLRSILERGEALRTGLLALVERDAAGFAPLARAYAIPKDDPARPETLEAATLAACEAPLEMMRLCGQAIQLLEELLEKGSVTLVSDVGCGALCCGAALESAGMNIFVNTRTLRDRQAASRLDAQTDVLLREYLPRARQVADEATRRVRREG